jgi:formylglycine-generating enzyme required for sulfatase activity
MRGALLGLLLLSPGVLLGFDPRGEMVQVPAGPFTYGIDTAQAQQLVAMLKEPWVSFYNMEHDRTTITLPAFLMDRYEVTNEVYGIFLRDRQRAAPRYWRFPQFNRAKQPVVGVGWKDADAFCRWAGKRLPTEEEWEKAARGTDGRIWPWGNQADEKRYNGRASANYAPVEVGKYPGGNSPYGISDLAGNVWEMTSTVWDAASHVMKGGSFLNTNADVRTMVRWAPNDEIKGANWLGFRCVMDLKQAR